MHEGGPRGIVDGGVSVYPALVASTAGANAGRGHLVLRVRLGIDYDYDSLDPLEFMDHLAERVREAAADAGAELDVLQVGVGARGSM